MDPTSIGMIGAETMLSAGSQLSAGSSADKAARYEAKQYKRVAQAERAAGTRDAYEERRKGRIMESDARAAMAASGGSASDAGAMEILGKIGAETEYNSLAALFESESAAQGYKRKADVRRYEGSLAKTAGYKAAIPTLLSGAHEIYKRWPGATGDDTSLYAANLKTNRGYGWNSGVG